MSLDLLRSLDPAAELAQGAVRARMPIHTGDATVRGPETAGATPEAPQLARTTTPVTVAPQRAGQPAELPAEGNGLGDVVPVAAVAPRGVVAPTDDRPPRTAPVGRPVPLIVAEAPWPRHEGPAAPASASSLASASAASSQPVTLPSWPTATRQTPRAPLEPKRAALLAPTSAARAGSAPAVLHVTIDRIDVRSAAPASAAAPARSGTSRPAPSHSLADYLRAAGNPPSSGSRGRARS